MEHLADSAASHKAASAPAKCPHQECFSYAINDFVTDIRQGSPFETDRLDNLETLRLMEACYAAAGVEV